MGLEIGQAVTEEWAMPNSYFMEFRNIRTGTMHLNNIPRTIRRDSGSILVEDHLEAVSKYDRQTIVHDKDVSGEYRRLDSFLKRCEGRV